MTNDPIIKIEQLEKSFGDLHVLKGIDLEVNRGEVVCIIGASGSGKSTLLRCINLLEEADSGHIWFDGQDLMDLKVNLNALRQKIGRIRRRKSRRLTWTRSSASSCAAKTGRSRPSARVRCPCAAFTDMWSKEKVF